VVVSLNLSVLVFCCRREARNRGEDGNGCSSVVQSEWSWVGRCKHSAVSAAKPRSLLNKRSSGQLSSASTPPISTNDQITRRRARNTRNTHCTAASRIGVPHSTLHFHYSVPAPHYQIPWLRTLSPCKVIPYLSPD